MEEKKKYVCPYCDYEGVKIVLTSYVCDRCKKKTSVYDENKRNLYKEFQNLDMNNILYSRELGNMVGVFVIDGVCVKNRHGLKSHISKKDIEERIRNYDSIGIQDGRKISIYCNEATLKMSENILKNLKPYYKSKKILIEENTEELDSDYDKYKYITINSPTQIIYFFN